MRTFEALVAIGHAAEVQMEAWKKEEARKLGSIYAW